MSLTYYLVSLVIASVLSLLLFWYCRYFTYRRHLKCFPQVKGYPLIGCALELLPSSALYRKLWKLKNDFGSNFWGMVGFDAFFVTSDPKLIKLILTSQVNITKAKFYKHFSLFFGEGLILSTGDKWRGRKKLLTPAFNVKILEGQDGVYNAATDILVDLLAEEVSKPSVNIHSYINLCLLDIICESAMGTPVNAQLNKDSKFVHCLEELGRIFIEKTIRPIENNDITYRLTSNYRVENECVQYYKEYTTEIIRRKRREMNVSRALGGDSAEGKKNLAFLELLLTYSENGEILSDDDIRDEVNTFIAAGTETTATTTSLVLYQLAHNLDIQEKVFAEIKDVFGDDKFRPATYKDLAEMKYMELVIKETLRFYSSTPLIGRELSEDLLYGDAVLPKGLTVLMSLYMLHKDPKYVKDPEAFDPERFRSQPPNRETDGIIYAPFSAGPRVCIGQKFSMISMKSVLSKVLRYYEMVPVKHELDLHIKVILTVENGVVVGLRRRIW